jgi:hypothetical protein
MIRHSLLALAAVLATVSAFTGTIHILTIDAGPAAVA